MSADDLLSCKLSCKTTTGTRIRIRNSIESKSLRNSAISLAIPENANKFFQTIPKIYGKVRGHLWTLNVGYNESVGGDFQLGATETSKYGESKERTILRCLKEEFGVEGTRKDIMKISSEHKIGRKSMYIGIVKVNNLRVLKKQAVKTRGRCDKTRKVMVIIVGSSRKIKYIMKRINKRCISDMYIDYFVSMKIDTMVNISKEIDMFKSSNPQLDIRKSFIYCQIVEKNCSRFKRLNGKAIKVATYMKKIVKKDMMISEKEEIVILKRKKLVVPIKKKEMVVPIKKKEMTVPVKKEVIIPYFELIVNSRNYPVNNGNYPVNNRNYPVNNRNYPVIEQNGRINYNIPHTRGHTLYINQNIVRANNFQYVGSIPHVTQKNIQTNNLQYFKDNHSHNVYQHNSRSTQYIQNDTDWDDDYCSPEFKDFYCWNNEGISFAKKYNYEFNQK